jgi:hypothetical protein
MAKELVWIFRGPKAGSFDWLDENRALQAEKDGWGQRAKGRDAYQFSKPVKTPFKPPPNEPAPSKQLYKTRELRAEKPK